MTNTETFEVVSGAWRFAVDGDEMDVYRNGEHVRTMPYPPELFQSMPSELGHLIGSLEREIAVEDAETRMGIEEATEVWDRQFDDDADPVRVEAAGRVLTGAGWQ